MQKIGKLKNQVFFLATAKQRNARKTVGQTIGSTYGRKNGMMRQGEPLKQTLCPTTVWCYTHNRDCFSTLFASQFYCLVPPPPPPQSTFADLSRFVQRLTSVDQRKIRVSSFYAVIHGKRKRMYGWQLVWVVFNG